MKKHIQITLIVDRQVALIIGAAIGILLIGMIGVSAHAGSRPILQLAGVHESQNEDAASAARTEPKETPEHTHQASPTEKPETSSTAKSTASPSSHPLEGD